METRFIAPFIVTMFVWVNSIHAEIRNGYEREIRGYRESLKRLTSIVHDGHISFEQRQQIKKHINRLQERIQYHWLTDELISAFKNISPVLYNQIDTITNSLGESVDVYVSLIPPDLQNQRLYATTNLACAVNEHQYLSEYGVNTVSVQVASLARALLLLAHEFGHVSYQVPHLATYLPYYKEHYNDDPFSQKILGHNDHDPSGAKALAYQVAYLQSAKYFKQNMNAGTSTAMVTRILKP